MMVKGINTWACHYIYIYINQLGHIAMRGMSGKKKNIASNKNCGSDMV